MANPVTPPRGMRDFLPADKARRERVLRVIRDSFAAHGFDEIETPVVEEHARLHSGLGGDNEKLAYAILKRGLGHGDLAEAAEKDDPESLSDLGLRFDLTVPLARFYATHRAELPAVFRAIQIGPVWRAERPQKGRYRQFVQCDIDIIGEPTPLAEVELIAAAAAALVALGLKDCTIRLNDRRILTGLLEFCGFAPERYPAVLISLDKLDKIGVDGVVGELAELGADAAAVLGGILDGLQPSLAGGGVDLTEGWITQVLPEGIDPDAVTGLLALADALAGMPQEVRLRFDPTLVRGMGYYTGTIFEISHPNSNSSLGGGGRYDGMIGRFLDAEVPAAGFSLGFERIIELVEFPAEGVSDSVVLIHDEVAPATLASLKAALISQGKRVRLERRPKNLKPLFEQLAASGYREVAFVTAGAGDRDSLEFRQLGR